MPEQESRVAEVRRDGGLNLSVVWGYVLAGILMLFILMILVPDADGPSPWDAAAFRSGMLEMLANFRVLDELVDLGIIKVSDVGAGFITVDLDLYRISARNFGWTPLYLAIACAGIALMLRSLRLRLLASHAGIPGEVRGQVWSYFFGRGMNLLFPFGAGELATTRALEAGGAESGAAAAAVFHNRVHEVQAINTLLVAGFIYLGWGGGVSALFWSALILAGVVSLSRPLGGGAGGLGIAANIWAAFHGRALVEATRSMLRTPGFSATIWLLSCVTLVAEILGLWCIKQAFSSPMDDYILMKDLTLIHFAMGAAVAALARIVPYTFASLGIYELAATLMFRVFDQGYLSAATVAILDSLLLNLVTLAFFLLALRLSACPSVLETWREFFRMSLKEAPEAS